MKKQTSARAAARKISRFCFLTLTVDHTRFDSVELATEAGKRQVRELLDFMREKKAEIHRSMLDGAGAVKHWHVLLSSDSPFSRDEIEAAWGLGYVNVLNWVDAALVEKYLNRSV